MLKFSYTCDQKNTWHHNWSSLSGLFAQCKRGSLIGNEGDLCEPGSFPCCSSPLWLEGCWLHEALGYSAFRPQQHPALTSPVPGRKGAGFDQINPCHVREKRTGTEAAEVIGYPPQAQSLKMRCSTRSMCPQLGSGQTGKKHKPTRWPQWPVWALLPQQNKLQSHLLFSSWKVELF